jgi:hypothetical protein
LGLNGWLAANGGPAARSIHSIPNLEFSIQHSEFEKAHRKVRV